MPAPARPAGKDFLGMVLPLATAKTNLPRLAPSWACSSLRPHQTGQRPWPTLSSLILPTLQTLARRVASLGLGRADSTLLWPRAHHGAPTALSGTQTHTLYHRLAPHSSCLGSAPFYYSHRITPIPSYASSATGETVTPRCPRVKASAKNRASETPVNGALDSFPVCPASPPQLLFTGGGELEGPLRQGPTFPPSSLSFP